MIPVPRWFRRPAAKSLATCFILVAATALVYQPVWNAGFIWDDDLHLLDNPVLKPGGLARAWLSPGAYINYWPLTFTAYRLQFELWGLNPAGFHLVNIALHALSAIFVWRILLLLRLPGALFAAALFALHPVNVESVAWIAQLKNILSLLFALLSVLFYLKHDQRGGWQRYALAIGFFCLSTLAKGMVVTLPVVLLACAWWQRGVITRRDVLRVLPYVLIGALMTLVEVWTQQLAATGILVRSDGLASRTAVAGCAVWFYLWKVLWPLDLVFVYPRWNIDPRDVLSYLPGVLLAIVLAVAWWRRRSWGRPVVMVLVCYVALLLPVLGFVNIYFMEYSLVADHWQYAAMIVPCAGVAAAAATLGRRRPVYRPAGVALCVGLAATLGALSWQQCRMYKDIERLYLTTIDRNPDCWMVRYNLGIILANTGRVPEAVDQYEAALQVNPGFREARNNLGSALTKAGRIPEAIEQFEAALRIDPDYAVAHNNLGSALARSGRMNEAIEHFRKAVTLAPRYANAHNNFGAALVATGQVREAVEHFKAALRINPDFPDARRNLDAALEWQRQHP